MRVVFMVLVIGASACADSSPSGPEAASEPPTAAASSAIVVETDRDELSIAVGADDPSEDRSPEDDRDQDPDVDEEIAASPLDVEEPPIDPGTADTVETVETVTLISPILGTLGLIEYDEAAQREQRRDFERAVQQCMKERGFEYTPQTVDSESTTAAPVSERIDPQFAWGTPGYADRYGFGITMGLLDDIDRARAGLDVGPEAEQDTDQAEYFRSLGEAGRRAYQIALYGDASSLDPSLSNDAASEALLGSDNPGCVLPTFDQNPTENERIYDEFEGVFGNVLSEIAARVEADPRVVAAQDGWVRCLQAADYSYADVFEPQMAVSELRYELAARIFGQSVPADGIVLESDALAALSDEEAQEYFASFRPTVREITPQLQQELDELLAFEIDLASAHVRCLEELSTVERTVRTEFEEQFVAENQGAIIALLERVSG